MEQVPALGSLSVPSFWVSHSPVHILGFPVLGAVPFLGTAGMTPPLDAFESRLFLELNALPFTVLPANRDLV